MLYLLVFQTHEDFYLQLLDIEYQKQPLDETKILAVFDQVNSSSLSADIKQKFYSRRYEFIDDIGSDVNCLYSLYQKHDEITGRKRNATAADPTAAATDGQDVSKKPKMAAATPAATAGASAYQQPAVAQQYGDPNTYAGGAAGGYNQGGYAAGGQYYGSGTGDWSQYYAQQASNYNAAAGGYGAGYQGYGGYNTGYSSYGNYYQQ